MQAPAGVAQAERDGHLRQEGRRQNRRRQDGPPLTHGLPLGAFSLLNLVGFVVRLVTAALHHGDDGLQIGLRRIDMHKRLFDSEVDRRLGHAIGVDKRSLHAGRAGAARHALNGQLESLPFRRSHEPSPGCFRVLSLPTTRPQRPRSSQRRRQFHRVGCWAVNHSGGYCIGAHFNPKCAQAEFMPEVGCHSCLRRSGDGLGVGYRPRPLRRRSAVELGVFH